ncbi:uncharacterized protein A4U43_C06F2450 [Asparagus officinalis]|uniref:Uncharacterized protein n=1 Tax=Asparagus officinalis TaxID=4686 RepID=A0A5P1EPG5_ASPOF|nr:uncharacterized protein A4U43_C06F2450 [Asparagus officinalis]
MGTNAELPAVANRLEGKVALITGGASGIGESTARLFCRHGAKVVIADVQDELGESVCGDLGAAASFIHCDVTNEDDISKAVDHAVEKFGQLDVMLNNAGIAGSPVSSVVDSQKSDFERVLSINLVGAFLGTKHAARVMIPARRWAGILATSSHCMRAAAALPSATLTLALQARRRRLTRTRFEARSAMGPSQLRVRLARHAVGHRIQHGADG